MRASHGVIRIMPASMPFSCDVSFIGDRAKVIVRGEIDIATAPMVLEHARDAMALAPGGIALDLGDVTFMDGSGVNSLEAMRDEAAALGVLFVLALVSHPVRFVLDVLDLTEMFGLRSRIAAPAPQTSTGPRRLGCTVVAQVQTTRLQTFERRLVRDGRP
jgi:anti-anti-sigma factor